MALLQNAHLSVLKLGYNNLGDEGLTTLAAGISEHHALESLDLGFNNVGDEGCRALAAAIPMDGALHTLYLAGNLIGEEGAVAIADAIRRKSGLRRLYMTGNRLGPDGVKAISEAILEGELRRSTEDVSLDEKAPEAMDILTGSEADFSASTGMQELFLGGTGMGSGGCQAVARLLAGTSCLRVLSLPNCDIGDEDVARIASSMKSNRGKLRLETLQLSFNRITCKGIEYLANAIVGSQTLRGLLLDNNEIADRGAQQLAAVLPYVKTLEKLDVGFNSMKSAGMKLIMKAVAETQSLQSLSVSGNTIDTSAAKTVAYAFAYNRSLISISLVHCSIESEGQRHISAGIVSNSRIALRELTGFKLGPVIVTLGFPPALEHWNNNQILNFIQLMWERSREDVAGSEESTLDPLHFLPLNPGETRLERPTPLDPALVVELAKKAFDSLIEEGVDIFSRRSDNPNEASLTSPIAGDNIMVESPNEADDNATESSLERKNAVTARSFVAPPEAVKNTLPDPTRKKRVVEWLCSNIQQLNRIAQQPFSSAELWRLHQHFFTPVVNESGGSVMTSPNPSADAVGKAVSSVPEVSGGNSADNPADNWSDSTEDSTVPVSDPASNVIGSLPILKRKVSYRFLGEAALASAPKIEATRLESRCASYGQGAAVSTMIEGGPTGLSMPPKTKRARRNRARISFLPRVKAKLDSYLDFNHEKALILMKQLYFVEQAILSGQVNPIDPSTTTRTHLSGDFAVDAEMIVVDMI